jgi:hypothetical protein
VGKYCIANLPMFIFEWIPGYLRGYGTPDFSLALRTDDKQAILDLAPNLLAIQLVNNPQGVQVMVSRADACTYHIPD